MTSPIMLIAAIFSQSVLENLTRFDLTCEGSKISISDESRRIGWSARYKFDLEKMAWCGQDCKSTYSIENLTEQKIDIGDRMLIDRTTGRLSALTISSELGAAKIDAVCTRQPFSGFPEKKF